MAPTSKKSPNKKSKHALNKFQKPSKQSFKPKSKSDHTVKSQAAALQLEDDVPDFPRGGGSSLSKEELDEVRAEVDAEFDAEGRGLKKRKNKRLEKQSHSAEDDLGSLFGGGISGKLPRFANRITWKNISPGMKLWGVIAEINEKDITISLPGGLRGLVRASEGFDPFSDTEMKNVQNKFFSSTCYVGQLVACIVLQLDDDKKEKGKRKIWLSLRLSLLHKSLSLDVIQEGMVLTAYVKSIEDHGYILHFGLPSFTGFMPKNSEAESTTIKISLGHLLQGVVKSIDRTRKVVYLSSDPDTVSKYVTRELKGISIDLLIPGMMVNARVKSTLENGIMLSFLTYFTGTVDMSHLQKTFPTSNWKDDYNQNKKVNARILFIDPSTRAVGLTLNPHLVHNKAPPSLVKTGDIFDRAKVIRVDRGSGLLLEVPSSPFPTPAYVSVTDVADKEVSKLEKTFKEGSHVRVRILGFKHLEGIAVGVLKTSAFEGSVFTHSDVKPGMVVKAKIIAVDSFGAIVQFAGGVKALCPLRHMSEFEMSKPRKKFQVGAELLFRVLGCKSKRITVTHKKTLVKSKLGIISSYTDATEGLITHGWITKIENHGCFVRFYNGVQGFAPRSELGLEPGCDPISAYHVEEVVKCRVTSSVPASRRINLSFIITPARVSEDDMVKLGRIVSGVVERVTPHVVVVRVNTEGYMKGTISTEHLSDNQGFAALMKSVLKPGYEFDQLLVLDVEGNNVILTAKYSLINSAEKLPAEVSQIRPRTVIHGYVCNLIESGCFVRYIGRLTGFVPRSKATDERKVNFSEAFYIGQSVRSYITDVCSETSRVTLSLKQSLCSSTDASFIQEHFLLEDKIANLQLSNSTRPELKWVKDFTIGDVVEGKVNDVKDFGVVVGFEKYSDVFGFVTHYQLGGIGLETGSIIRAAILDVAKIECLVDLSLKPSFVDRLNEESSNIETNKKKRKRETHKKLEVHQTVNATVEIVKDNYLVLSIPEHNFTIGYASLTDYNTQKFPSRQHVNGQSVIATIMALPSPATAGRLLLLLKSMSEVTETSSSKRAKKKSSYDVGALVQAEITEIKPLELKVKFGSGFQGRVHITEASDDNIVEDPFKGFRIGQTLAAAIVSKNVKSENKRKNYHWELSIKRTLVTGSEEIGDKLTAEDFSYSVGQHVTGFVYKVDKDWVWLTVSRNVKAQLYLLDSACEPTELLEFQKRYYVGKTISGYILSADKERKLVRLVLQPFSAAPDRTRGCRTSTIDGDSSLSNVVSHIHEGDVVGGRISKILPGLGGMLIQIDPRLHGKVNFTELKDLWESDPLSGYHEGQFVKCKVLEVSHSVKGTFHIDLSLRSSLIGVQSQKSIDVSNNVDSPSQRVESIEDIHPNMTVQGYVKNVTPKGCFIMLSRNLDAKILLSNLSDGFVKNPEKDFPIGKLVVGKVISVEPLSKRVEVTLKTPNASNAQKSYISGSLKVGDIVSGRIKRIESYGLFITVDDTNMVGLCHVSELSDDHVDNIETKYRAGEKVTVKVLKVDEDRHRISLGMKNSYFSENYDVQAPSKKKSDDEDDENDHMVGTQLNMLPGSGSSGIQSFDIEYENGEHPVLADVEARASILPLEVPLDDIENSGMDDVIYQCKEQADDVNAIDEKSKRRAKRKEKEEREREIMAAEERLLEKDIPRSADEFEKLVRSSPNSSFIWIKYMAFMLSLADVENARSIAERALKTINIREETEKLNIWVAYFNLENEYGNPPEEAVQKIFQRALQYCDPKKVHLALLGMYERTEQPKLADDLLNKMIRKFKHSCKVWLRRIQWLLNQNRDDVQSVVKRAVLCLPQHKHIKFLSQTAILEFKCGVPDRGRSMFEGMLREYPKRTDLWSVYLDQEIRLGDVDLIRALFERAISLSLPPKKMKFLFKKYLEYEKSVGDEERIESVKTKAMEYVESALA
ncbi:RRNA biogenesis protein [Actinidia chinensis var. chinensis]|uniref:Protein RRP5 homolog n=1 Tax=Actinidia chinensis var. chinensis TaxID=1590841 RepID=A0A2R6S1X8_ACTCC|nr:RRNA biogenesis protein [Actinidia chinensis var. chinensis]